jgi:hypothetical protein
MLARFDYVEQTYENHEGVVNGAGVGVKMRKEGGWLFSRQGESNGEAAVPEPGVVGADIAHHGEVVEEGAEDFFIEPVGVGDGLPVCRCG